MRARLGVTLPSFREDPAVALRVATVADDAGLDGVFVFDHLFRVARDGRKRPAQEATTLLAAVAAATATTTVGTLVVRATLRPPAVLAHALDTVARVAPGRVVATLGTGDAESREENESFGLPYGTVGERLHALDASVAACGGRGYPVWVGGPSRGVRRVAASRADGWSRWSGSATAFASEVADLHALCEAGGRDPAALTLSWGGLVVVGDDARDADAKATRLGVTGEVIVGGPEQVAEQVAPYVGAGAAWVVLGPVDSSDPDNAVRLAEGVAPLLA